MAGTVRIDITPPAGVMLQGHSARKEPGDRIHDNLFLKVLTLKKGAKRIALVTSDLIYFTEGFAAGAKRMVRREAGLAPGDVMLTASHTHTGPVMLGPEHLVIGKPPLSPYVELLQHKIAGGVREAVLREQPVRMRRGAGRVNIGAVNRRKKTSSGVGMLPNPGGPLDEEVPVIAFYGKGGTPAAIVFNCVCHPTTLSTQIHEVSADYPGVAQREVERIYPGCNALFTNGCSGDVRPDITEGGRFKGGSFEDVERMGRILAACTAQTVEKAAWEEVGAVESASEEFMFPLDRDMFAGDESGIARMLERVSGSVPDEAARRWEELRRMKLGEEEKPARAVPGELQVFKLGGARLLGLPGEVMVEIGLRIKKRAPGVLIAGYANGCLGYIPTRKAMEEGGYEAMSYISRGYPGPYSPGMEDKLVRRAARMLAG